MDRYNFKVVAELRDDLTDGQREVALRKIEELQQKLKIVNIDAITFCKAQPFEEYNDFSSVYAFFHELRKIKDCFSNLTYYDLWEGEVRIAV